MPVTAAEGALFSSIPWHVRRAVGNKTALSFTGRGLIMLLGKGKLPQRNFSAAVPTSSAMLFGLKTFHRSS